MEELDRVINEIESNNLSKIVISNRRLKSNEIQKKVLRCVLNKGNEVIQIESFTEKQAFHAHIERSALKNELLNALQEYKQIDIFMKDETITVKANKVKKIHVYRSNEGNKVEELSTQNRKKKYLLEEGMNIPAFYDLGIFTKEGKIAHSHYDKFKQINRFIEMVNDVVDDSEEVLRIVDFGCGKSYLTFVLYYFLSEVKNRKVEIVGLDLKKEVIENCNRIAKKYGYDTLRFELGDINGYHMEQKIDIVISLHACDTATDHAIFNAIKWNVTTILSVPCCQHEINQTLQNEPFGLMNRYGLIKERYTSLVTDTIRGMCLESKGYDVQMLEFIDIAHSPKNLLIRAVKKNINNPQAFENVKRHQEAHGYKQTLVQLLEDDNESIY